MKKLFLLVMGIAAAYAPNNTEAATKLKMQTRPPATCAGSRTFALSGPIDLKNVHANAVTIGNDSTLYVQIGGGSAATTLLFGPLGAVANMAAIKNRTKSQAGALDKEQIVDPLVSLEQYLPAQAAGISSQPEIIVTPFVAYLRPKKSDLVERRVVLEVQCDGWKGWYSYHLQGIPAEKLGMEMTEQEYLDYQTQLQSAQKTLISLFQADASGKLAVTGYNKISSWILNPYFSSPFPQAIIGEFDGRTVLLGQGEIDKNQYLFAFMKGMHLFDAGQLEIGEALD